MNRILCATLPILLAAALAAPAASNDFDGNHASDSGFYRPDDGSWIFMLMGINNNNNGFQYGGASFGYAGTLPVTGDFDGDGRCDIGCYDYTSGQWFFSASVAGFSQTQFGYSGTLPVTGDFDGDGRDDFGVYDLSSGDWYLNQSSNG